MFRFSTVTWANQLDTADRTRLPATGQTLGDLPDPGRDLALAEHAVTYLREHGLDDAAVVQCLRDEFDIDLATAERMAGPSMTDGTGPRRSS